jgi:ATP-dependent Lhr-like helicase
MSDERSKLDPRIASAFYGGFQELRPVQAAAIEPLITGRNVVLSSGTGSGKTEAVTAPLMSRFWIDALKEDQTVMLYVAPTKALINDIAKRLESVLQPLSLRVGIRHGDRNDLNRASKPHVLITTPESLNVMLRKKEPLLAQVRCVVIDEIHLLFNTQRGLHLSVLLGRLRKLVGRPLQWAALSATIGKLSAVSEFFFGPEEKADFLQFPATRTIEAQIRMTNDPGELRKLFVSLMDAPRRKLLVFTNSRKSCESLAAELQQAPELSSRVFTHYSSLSTELREETERKFAEAPCAVCVATSTLEIGIDIGDIDAVVLTGNPPSIPSFLQRIGRGNRRSNKTNVICLCLPGLGAPREALTFASLLRVGREGRMPMAGSQKLWGAVAQQCLSIIQQEEGNQTLISELAAEVGALPHIDRPAVERILTELASADILQKHGFKNRYGAAEGLWEMDKNKMLFANFPLSSHTIDIRSGRQILGTVPRQNLIKMRQGTKVRFAGRVWAVKFLDPAFVEVEASFATGAVIDLSYGGTANGGLDSFHAQALLDSLFYLDESSSCMSTPVWELVEPLLLRIRSQVDPDSVPFEKTTCGFRYFTFAGNLANKVIAKWFKGNAQAESDLTITSDILLDWSRLPTDSRTLLPQVEAVFSPSTMQTVFQQRLPVDMQREEWLQEWLQDHSITETLERLKTAVPKEIIAGSFAFLLPQNVKSNLK